MFLVGGALLLSHSQARAEDYSGTSSASSEQAREQAKKDSENAREQANQESERAREQAKQDSERVREQAKQDQEMKKAQQENDAVTETEDNEDDVNKQIDSLILGVSSTLSNLAEVNSDTLLTYGDVTAALQNYAAALDQLVASASVTSSLGSGLSQPEMNLLSTLVSKHRSPFVSLSARVQEIKDQMKVVSDLLTPLSSANISPLLKKPLVSMLKDFREQIMSLQELDKLSFDILDLETSN